MLLLETEIVLKLDMRSECQQHIDSFFMQYSNSMKEKADTS